MIFTATNKHPSLSLMDMQCHCNEDCHLSQEQLAVNKYGGNLLSSLISCISAMIVIYYPLVLYSIPFILMSKRFAYMMTEQKRKIGPEPFYRNRKHSRNADSKIPKGSKAIPING